MPTMTARIEPVVLLKIQAYDWNCPQHITPSYTIDEFEQMNDSL